ncbi:MAG TPA: RNA polymerase-binding protein RbpA, partial [Micromonosporaceae bacterium]
QLNPPDRPHTEPYKTHLAYVKERRSEADAEAILAEAMQRLRSRRGEP